MEEAIQCPRISADEYYKFFNELPEEIRREVIENFGTPPGNIMVDSKGILVPVIISGNIAIGIQPSRRKILESADDIHSTIHDKTKPPHHRYLAFYFWLEKIFNADVIIHLGTHGTLEFMKGKEIGLSYNCYPDILIGSTPHLYVLHPICQDNFYAQKL